MSYHVALGENAPIAYSFNIEVDPVKGGDTLSVKWGGIPNRIPNKGDYVALWQNIGGIPWGTAPSNVQSVTNTSPDGSLIFTKLSLTSLSYVVGYSVGSDQTAYSNFAAVLPLGLGGTAQPLQNTTINLVAAGPTSFAFQYTTPSGSTPETFLHRVGIAKGQMYRPDGGNQVIIQSVTSNNDSDVVAFENLPLPRGSWYTAAYFCGLTYNTVAATYSFFIDD